MATPGIGEARSTVSFRRGFDSVGALPLTAMCQTV
jgi:hypothetical protein